MEYFALLTVATLIIAVLTLVLYYARRDVGLVVGTAALYYWSLYGAWYVVIDKSGGYSGKNYQYLENKLFPIALDRNYMIALELYAAFIILVQLTLIVALSRRKERHIPRLTLRHEPILLIAFAAGIGSYFIIQDKLSAAWTLNTSAYLYTRAETDQWFTLHQVLNRVAMIPPALGFATLVAGERSRYFVNVVTRATLPGYLLLFAAMGAFTFILGNKNEVLMALLAGFLMYMASVERPNLWKAGATLAGGFWFLYSIDFFRAVPISEMRLAIAQRVSEATQVGRFLTSSNEAYAAHFSMYGVLAAGTEPRFGYSLYSLVCSVIPRVLWPGRPQDIYLYYSESVGAIQNQGYSLHHATGWFLNFGYAGVALGAVVMGLVWAYCLNAHQRVGPKSGLLPRLFGAVAAPLFVACLPPLVRAGPEGYKGFLIEGVLIPMATLFFACRPRRAPKGAHGKGAAGLVWNRQLGWVLKESR